MRIDPNAPETKWIYLRMTAEHLFAITESLERAARSQGKAAIPGAKEALDRLDDVTPMVERALMFAEPVPATQIPRTATPEQWEGVDALIDEYIDYCTGEGEEAYSWLKAAAALKRHFYKQRGDGRAKRTIVTLAPRRATNGVH